MSWTVEKADEKVTSQDAGMMFCEFLLNSFNDYLNGAYDAYDPLEYGAFEKLHEWLEEGNRIQVTYGIDGLHIVNLQPKETKSGLQYQGSR